MEEIVKIGDLSGAEPEAVAQAAATVLDNKKGIDVKDAKSVQNAVYRIRRKLRSVIPYP